MSTGDLVVGLIIAVLAIGAIYILWNNHRKGKSSCGCNCSGCSKTGSCSSCNVTIEENETCDCCKKE